MSKQLLAFNPNPSIQSHTFAPGLTCYVVDDALLDPARLVRFADNRRTSFQSAPFNAYPGLEFPTPGEISERLSDFFTLHIRNLLGGRRTARMYSRLSLVTVPPAQLEPRQAICHRDHQAVDPARLVAACVLYLFRDESLGGTSFFVPRQSDAVTSQMIHDASTLDSAAFFARYLIPRDYCRESGEYFERVGTVPARYNRIVFYDGGSFHSAAVGRPERLTASPVNGRLTLNGFFDCSRKAS